MKNFIFLIVVSLISANIEVDISAPSFPDISDYFDISDGLTQMTIAVNFLGFCISSIIYGPASDAFGRRKIMLIGNGIMLVGACGCVISESIEFLLFSRFIQGLGASTSIVLSIAMVSDRYSTKKSAKIFGIMNALCTIFVSAAPVVGGFVNELASWRGNYAIVAIISIISWLLMYNGLPETKENLAPLSIKKTTLDFKKLFSSKAFMLSSLIPSICTGGWMSFVSSSSFLYMETYNLHIIQYSMHQCAIIAVFSFFSFYSGKVTEIFGERNCIIYGALINLLGDILIMVVAVNTNNSPYLTTLTMMIGSIGAALFIPALLAISLEVFPEIKGTASSFTMSMRSLVIAVFISVSSYIYSGQLFTVALMLLIGSILVNLCLIKLLTLMSFDKKATKENI